MPSDMYSTRLAHPHRLAARRDRSAWAMVLRLTSDTIPDRDVFELTIGLPRQ
jgi:hypothetical protein